MPNYTIRRATVSVSAIALSTGLAVAIGMGTASAEPAEFIYESDFLHIMHVISDDNPRIGDTITSQTTINFPGATEDQITDYFGNSHDSCLNYVADSAKANGAPVPVIETTDSIQIGDKVLTSPADSLTFEFTFQVSDQCAIGKRVRLDVNFQNSLHTLDIYVPVVTVQKAASATNLTVAHAPQAGAETTLTATVAPTTLTGDVEFYDGATKLGTSALIDGTATHTWTPDQVGHDYALTAKYIGDAITDDSTSAPSTGTVAAVPAAPAKPTNVSATPHKIRADEKVTVTGNAEPGSAVTVTAGTQTCAAAANDDGEFSCEITPNAPGTLTLTATATLRELTSEPSDPITVTVTDRTTLTLGSLVLYIGSLAD